MFGWKWPPSKGLLLEFVPCRPDASSIPNLWILSQPGRKYSWLLISHYGASWLAIRQRAGENTSRTHPPSSQVTLYFPVTGWHGCIYSGWLRIWSGKLKENLKREQSYLFKSQEQESTFLPERNICRNKKTGSGCSEVSSKWWEEQVNHVVLILFFDVLI